MFFWLIISFMILIGLGLVIPSFIQNRKLAISILIFLPLTCLFLYLISGRYSIWHQHQLIQQKLTDVHSDIRQFGQPKNLILQLEQKVHNDPNDAKAWYFLGKLYLGIGALSKADNAFKKAKQLAPESIDYEFFSVQTHFFIHQSLNQKEKDFLAKLLKNQPDHLAALNLLALDAYHSGHYDLAIQYWENILKQLPGEAIEDRKSIQEKIHQTKKKQA